MSAEALRDRYRDPVEIARGSEGVRYAALLPDGTPVVVLALDAELATRILSTERFFETLERASLVRHEALARPLTWGRSADGTFHIAYPAAEEDGLVAGALSPGALASIGVQLAYALDAVHAIGLAHGAITRERIGQAKTMSVRLNDFGLFAALVAGGVDVRVVVAAVCEAPYVSPEVQSGAVPDKRSDVFSLGAALYELLTGKPPYGGRTTVFMLASVLADDEGAAAASSGASPVVDAVVRAIERAPDDRWPSASAFAQALSAGLISGRQGVVKLSKPRGCLPGAVVAALYFAHACFQPDDRGSNPEESPGSTGQVAR